MDGATGAGNPELEVRLLGPLVATRADEPVVLGGPKPRALLAVLALEPGRVVSVDRLVEALWPGDPPETAAHAVQVYVSQLRKALGPVIATRGPGYELELPPERVDVHRFARLAHEGRVALEADDAVAAEGALREALALWTGPALADFLYEPFAQTEIARLEELRTVALEERIDADLALGRHAELVSELEALVQAQPLREHPRAQLMLALYRSGRQADALAAYRAARETLVEELGIDPGPELRELEAAILRQDESLLLDETQLARPMQFRRLATILFCDVVESMAIAEELDPEALARVQRRYFEAVSAPILRHRGTVEKYAGDAVMAAFGIPVAYEDHALRAARAALEIEDAIRALSRQLEDEHGFGLEVRIGIAAGEVVSTSTGGHQRFVAGAAVGVSARLEHAARPGEIVVSEIVARLIDHAARLEPLGDLNVSSRTAPIAMFRLLELVPVAPTFGRRMDAPLVGRKRELAALRRSLKRAVDSGGPRVSLVVAPPGVGKSRLAAEFTRRAKGVGVLSGRCLAYGDGITYWPLREALAGAGESEERDAVVAALEAETPPPAPELAWLFRRFCEARAHERALVLVFDDVHWAEPTFLELLEHLADKGEAPIHVICLAREELAEARPTFLEGRANVDRIEPAALSVEETQALVDALGGTVLESDQRSRLVATAEGNPLFLEQLLALALEGGLGAGRLPETIQALLAARLDRLGPGERAVLERGAVVGREFSAAEVMALLDADAVPTADAYLSTLAGRGFVRRGGDGRFAFRHVLVQDAVYRAAPKRLRAELHERYADRLETESPDLPDLDEFVGYHLEQAYRLRTELGEADRRTERLAADGGERLGRAGFRAMTRGDMHATSRLLGRSVSLLPEDAERRRELLCELGITFRALGDVARAEAALESAVALSTAHRDRRVELRAAIELGYLRLLGHSEDAVDVLLELAGEATRTFDAVGDQRALGRTWLIVGYVFGGIQCQHGKRQDAAEHALQYYKVLKLSTSSPLGELAASLYYGPSPVEAGIARCDQLLADPTTDSVGRANLLAFQGGLEAQRGNFDHARSAIATALVAFEELGQGANALTYAQPVLADAEMVAGRPEAAEEVLMELCQRLERLEDWSHLSTRAADLAEAVLAQGRHDDARSWAELSAARGSPHDLATQIRLATVESRLAAASDPRGAIRLARRAVGLAATTDALNLHGRALEALADALAAKSEAALAARALAEARSVFLRKGNTAALAAVDRLGAVEAR